MTASAKTLVTLATYNEIDNLPALVDEILGFVPHAHVLVIDDNSPDGTGRWCDQRAGADPRVQCLHRTGKLGLGTAIIAGLKAGLEQGYEQIVNMDADFSHHPRYLPAILDGMQPANGPPVDCMIGSRYCPGGGVDGWPVKRLMMSRAVNFYARTMLGLSPQDCSGAYRCYRASILRKIDFDRIRSRGYAFQEEILLHIKNAGGRFGETPIIFADRVKGVSKINRKEALEALRVIFQLGAKRLIPFAN